MTYIDASGKVRKALRIDETLIAQIAQDNEEALHMLYEQASAAVFAYAFSVLKNCDEGDLYEEDEDNDPDDINENDDDDPEDHD